MEWSRYTKLLGKCLKTSIRDRPEQSQSQLQVKRQTRRTGARSSFSRISQMPLTIGAVHRSGGVCEHASARGDPLISVSWLWQDRGLGVLGWCVKQPGRLTRILQRPSTYQFPPSPKESRYRLRGPRWFLSRFSEATYISTDRENRGKQSAEQYNCSKR